MYKYIMVLALNPCKGGRNVQSCCPLVADECATLSMLCPKSQLFTPFLVTCQKNTNRSELWTKIFALCLSKHVTLSVAMLFFYATMHGVLIKLIGSSDNSVFG